MLKIYDSKSLIRDYNNVPRIEQVIRYNLVWVNLRLINREASITCSTISNIPYNLIFTTKFNDSSI